MYTNLNWHGTSHEGPFTSSQQAYDTLHIGSVGAANRLQAGPQKKARASAAKKKPARRKK
jgi:hypothetical protein